jgi:hypothetical protein
MPAGTSNESLGRLNLRQQRLQRCLNSASPRPFVAQELGDLVAYSLAERRQRFTGSAWLVIPLPPLVAAGACLPGQ